MTDAERSEWDRLNAYVDDELPPHEQQAMRERARHDPLVGLQVAGLRELKREVRSASHTLQPRLWAITAAIAVIVLAGGLVGYLGSVGGRLDRKTVVERLAEVVPASSSAGPPALAGVTDVPDLEPAGFKLVSAIANAPDGIGLVYQGPRGCRIGLASLDPGDRAGGDVGADAGTRTWTVAGRRFVLLASGMDPGRFARLALAIEEITRGGDATAVRVALRDASTGQPCLS